MNRILAGLLIASVILAVSYEGCKFIQGSDGSFKTALDSLNKQNDSLKAEILAENKIIDSLVAVDSALHDEIENQEAKVVTVVKYVDLSKKAIDTYSEKELISSFNKRYPQDTVSSPLPLARPVLTSAAKDLVELDGAKQIIEIKDSVIALQKERIEVKDTIIGSYVAKELKYVKIIDNKDLQINTWIDQYNKLQLENKKLKIKSKFQKIASYVVVGGLGIFLIAK